MISFHLQGIIALAGKRSNPHGKHLPIFYRSPTKACKIETFRQSLYDPKALKWKHFARQMYQKSNKLKIVNTQTKSQVVLLSENREGIVMLRNATPADVGPIIALINDNLDKLL